MSDDPSSPTASVWNIDSGVENHQHSGVSGRHRGERFTCPKKVAASVSCIHSCHAPYGHFAHLLIVLSSPGEEPLHGDCKTPGGRAAAGSAKLLMAG